VSKTYTDISRTHPTDTLIPEEAHVKAGAKSLPVVCRKAPFRESLNTCCYFISFKKDVRKGFKLFSNSAPAELRVQKPKITQCPQYLRFHNPRNCTRTERCLKCGKPSDKHKDTTANCPSTPQYANCNGPHRADSPKCPARPTIKDGEKVHATKTQLKAIRELGQQEYSKITPQTKKPTPISKATPTTKTLAKNKPATGGPRIRLPLSSSAPQPPTQRPVQQVTIKVNSNNDNSSMRDSPARSEVHVAGSDNKEEAGDKDIKEAPSGEDKPTDKDL
jgi:hypothetical protein